MDGGRAWERRRRGASRSPSGDGEGRRGAHGSERREERVDNGDKGRPKDAGVKRRRGRGVGEASVGLRGGRRGGGRGRGRLRGRLPAWRGKGPEFGGLGSGRGKGSLEAMGGCVAGGPGVKPGLVNWRSELAGSPEFGRNWVRDRKEPGGGMDVGVGGPCAPLGLGDWYCYECAGWVHRHEQRCPGCGLRRPVVPLRWGSPEARNAGFGAPRACRRGGPEGGGEEPLREWQEAGDGRWGEVEFGGPRGGRSGGLAPRIPARLSPHPAKGRMRGVAAGGWGRGMDGLLCTAGGKGRVHVAKRRRGHGGRRGGG